MTLKANLLRSVAYMCTSVHFNKVRLHPTSRRLDSGVQGFIQTPQGGYNPQFSCDTPPNHLKFKGGYQGGVYVIVMEWVINVVKY